MVPSVQIFAQTESYVSGIICCEEKTKVVSQSLTDVCFLYFAATLYIQKNDLTGDITSLCEPYGSPQLFSALGLDCLEVICPCCGQIDYKWFVDPCFY